MERLKLWAQDLQLVLATSLRGFADDPLLFSLQVTRRLKLARTPSRERLTLTNAYLWFLADRADVAARIAVQLPPGRGLKLRLLRRLLVQLGLDRATEADPPRLRWLDRIQVGDLTGALEVVHPRSAAARRTASDLRLLQPSAAPTHPAPAASSSVHRPLFILTNSLPYTHSGYTLRSHAILKALAGTGMVVEAATRIGYPTTIGTPGVPRSTRVDGIRYHRLPSAHLPLEMDKRLAKQQRLLEKLAGKLRPTVLHCTTDFTNAVVTRGLARRLGLPWVYEMRGQLEHTWVSSRPEALQGLAAHSERVRLLRAKEAELARDANAVIVLSEVQRQDLMQRGVAAESIHVVPNAVDAALTGPSLPSSEARRQLGLSEDGFWVGSVSSLVDYEGFDVLLHAVKHAREAGVDVRCALVGDGVSRPGLLGLVERLGLRDVVVMPGRVDRSATSLWHQSLDAFAVPRRDIAVTRVVTPLKPLEAMALGKPVVASDLPALAELTSQPGTGLVFPAGDAHAMAAQITRLARDPDLAGSLGEAGRVFAETRTWQNAAGLIAGIYQKECGGQVR